MRKPTVAEIVLVVVIAMMGYNMHQTDQRIDSINTSLVLMGMYDDSATEYNGVQLGITSRILDRIDTLEEYNWGGDDRVQ